MSSLLTSFLTSLRVADHEDVQTQTCEFYLAHVKSVQNPASCVLGWVPVPNSDSRMYYYELPGGVVEIEVFRDGDGFNRRVTDFITDPADLQEMLGRPVRSL